jgi:hypothetical protein
LNHRVTGLLLMRCLDMVPCRLHTLTAEMIMATGVVGFRPVESVANVLAALHSTTHNGFPIAFTPEGSDVLPIVRSGLGHGAGTGGGSHGSLVSLAQLGAMQGRMMQGTPTPEPGPPGLAPPAAAATALGEVTAAAAAAVGGVAAEAQAAAAAAAGGGSPVPPGGAVGGGVVASCEGGRLEGVILRSQLLVLLQRRHFCDQHGRPVGHEYNEKEEIELEVRPGCCDSATSVERQDRARGLCGVVSACICSNRVGHGVLSMACSLLGKHRSVPAQIMQQCPSAHAHRIHC